MKTPPTLVTRPIRAMLGLSLVTACSSGPSLSSRYQTETEEPGGAPQSVELLLVADNQMNWLFGDPFFLRTEFADRMIAVAIRPVQLDLFGEELLGWVVDHRKTSLVVHLGDAANTSCNDEYDRFEAIMDRAPSGWLMAPGNHDGYFDGNGHVDVPSVANLGLGANTWSEACKGAKGPMDRNGFLRRYLGTLAKKSPAVRQAFGAHPDDGDVSVSGPSPGLRRARWHIEPKSPWRSYLLQEIDFSYPGTPKRPVRGFLLDTNQFVSAPTIVPTPESRNAGMSGDIQADQRKALEEWLGEVTPGELVVLFGHHPYGDLSAHGRETIDWARRHAPVSTYVSAHTHAGEYRVNEADDETWLELNLGSITDWPPEFRTFQLSCVSEGDDCSPTQWADGRVALRSALHRLPVDWSSPNAKSVPACDAAWEIPVAAEDHYLSYMGSSPSAALTQRKLLRVAIRSLVRLLENVPSLPCAAGASGCVEDARRIEAARSALEAQPELSISDLRDVAEGLEVFERSREAGGRLDKAAIEKRHLYRLCQAFWASKYEQRGARVPAVEDWLITFPRK